MCIYFGWSLVCLEEILRIKILVLCRIVSLTFILLQLFHLRQIYTMGKRFIKKLTLYVNHVPNGATMQSTGPWQENQHNMKLIHFLNRNTHRSFLAKLKQWSLQETSYVVPEQFQAVGADKSVLHWRGWADLVHPGQFEWLQQDGEISHTCPGWAVWDYITERLIDMCSGMLCLPRSFQPLLD